MENMEINFSGMFDFLIIDFSLSLMTDALV